MISLSIVSLTSSRHLRQRCLFQFDALPVERLLETSGMPTLDCYKLSTLKGKLFSGDGVVLVFSYMTDISRF